MSEISHEAAARVAEAEQAVEIAEAALTAANERLLAIRQRVVEVEEAQRRIHAKHADGTITGDDKAELLLLDKDLEVLRTALAEAEAAAVERQEAVDAANGALAKARAAFEKHEAQARVEALRSKASELDSLLCGVIRELHEAARPLGHVSTIPWDPSGALEKFFRVGWIP